MLVGLATLRSVRLTCPLRAPLRCPLGSAWSRTTGSSAHPRGSQGLPTLPRLALITESLASKGVVRRLPSAVRLLATRYWLGQYGRGEVLQYVHNTDAWHGVQSRKYGAWVTGTHVRHECWTKRQRNRAAQPASCSLTLRKEWSRNRTPGTYSLSARYHTG